MGRKHDPERREALLAATAAYLEQHGLAGLSLRPLGAALGVSPRTLLYHFGSKEQLLAEALNTSQALREAVAEFVGSDRAAGLDHFVHSLVTFVSIGLGVLVGNALVLRITSRSRRRRPGA